MSHYVKNPVALNIASDTAASVAMLVKYIGTNRSATTDIEVEAGGDIKFRVAGVADTDVNTNGTIDCSTPGAGTNTLGEVLDLINASDTWRAVLVDGLRSDLTDNTLTVRAVTAASVAEGVPLYFDSTVSLHAGGALLPQGLRTDIRAYLTPNGQLLENPFAGVQIDLRWLAGYSTWNTTSNFYIYSVKSSNKATTGSEVVTTLWQEAAGATGTNKQLTQFQYFGLRSRPHEKLICRIVDTATGSAYFMQAYGVQVPVNC